MIFPRVRLGSRTLVFFAWPCGHVDREQSSSAESKKWLFHLSRVPGVISTTGSLGNVRHAGVMLCVHVQLRTQSSFQNQVLVRELG